jgi:hypothetical protein
MYNPQKSSQDKRTARMAKKRSSDHARIYSRSSLVFQGRFEQVFLDASFLFL